MNPKKRHGSGRIRTNQVEKIQRAAKTKMNPKKATDYTDYTDQDGSRRISFKNKPVSSVAENESKIRPRMTRMTRISFKKSREQRSPK
jgi:hypothetical protein